MQLILWNSISQLIDLIKMIEENPHRRCRLEIREIFEARSRSYARFDLEHGEEKEDTARNSK